MMTSFEIAPYTVTNAQYKLFMDNNGYDAEASWWDEFGQAWLQRDDDTLTDVWHVRQRKNKKQPAFWGNPLLGIARPNHPVVGISWYEAMAFCRWLTQNTAYNPEGHIYLLPSEMEWEYAARGTAGRSYPWGEEEPTTEWANYMAPDSNDFSRGPYGATAAVGCFPRDCTPEGVYDLVGNIWEWTQSLAYPYPYLPDDGREATLVPYEAGIIFRGACWGDAMVFSPLPQRVSRNPDVALQVLGFRLVRYPPNKT
jgi:formylglycine-generating enzyme required for sulfatase activity